MLPDVGTFSIPFCGVFSARVADSHTFTRTPQLQTEFADDSVLLGEEGYVLATVQTAVEYLILKPAQQ